MVRAKFKVSSIETYEGGAKSVKLNAVSSYGDNENKDFAKATPSGEIRISISPEVKAAEYFEPGKSYYVDFTEVPAESKP